MNKSNECSIQIISRMRLNCVANSLKINSIFIYLNFYYFFQSPPTPLIPMQHSEIREPGIIQNPTPPSPLLQMSTETHDLHDSYTNRPNQFSPRSFVQPSLQTMPPLTSNGYVTHDAIIGKVNILQEKQFSY